ncbi:hypothetical protein [Fodinicurvata sp. EGI_FJ10296]|uniref:hypothetical protein n=1 Tax=Fodinicurvata sp. EGI_FJ10296 TaxID=3231908 RepID=UPI0034569F9C
MKRYIVLSAAFCAIAAVTLGMEAGNLPGPLSVQSAEAQQMGKRPWAPSQRNRSMAAQFQHAERQAERNGGGGSGAQGALEQYVNNYTYNSSSTSVGNLNEITQNLSDGSVGTVHQTTDQLSDGNQGSAANTEVAVNSETQSESSADTNIGAEGGDRYQGKDWFSEKAD